MVTVINRDSSDIRVLYTLPSPVKDRVCQSDLIKSILDWMFMKRYSLTDRRKVFAWTSDGKKYLSIVDTGWRGAKRIRRFEVLEELDDNYRPIPFGGREAAKF